jgi:hypothetical protein
VALPHEPLVSAPRRPKALAERIGTRNFKESGDAEKPKAYQQFGPFTNPCSAT